MKNDKYAAMAHRLKMLSAISFKLVRLHVEKKLQKAGVDISPLSLVVLRRISGEVCTLGSLSKQMIIAPASLVPVIDILAEKGLISRGSDPADRRRNPLTLTQKGKILLAKLHRVRMEDTLAIALSRLGDRKSAQLIELTEELAAILQGKSKWKK